MKPRAATTEQILDAADRVARQEGIDKLTVRRLCAELGVTAPAIYRHFSSKGLIVEEVIDRIVGRTELPGPERGDWADRLKLCFVSVHDQVAPYAGLSARMGKELPKSAAAKRNAEYLDNLLSGAGISQEDAARIIFAVFVYVWGHLLAAGAMDSAPGQKRDEKGSRLQFLWGLDHLLGSFRREFGGQRPPSNRRPKSTRAGYRVPDDSGSKRTPKVHARSLFGQ